MPSSRFSHIRSRSSSAGPEGRSATLKRTTVATNNTRDTYFDLPEDSSANTQEDSLQLSSPSPISTSSGCYSLTSQSTSSSILAPVPMFAPALQQPQVCLRRPPALESPIRCICSCISEHDSPVSGASAKCCCEEGEETGANDDDGENSLDVTKVEESEPEEKEYIPPTPVPRRRGFPVGRPATGGGSRAPRRSINPLASLFSRDPASRTPRPSLFFTRPRFSARPTAKQ